MRSRVEALHVLWVITYYQQFTIILLFVLHKHCFQFLLGLRQIENNAYAKFWRDKNEYYGKII